MGKMSKSVAAQLAGNLNQMMAPNNNNGRFFDLSAEPAEPLKLVPDIEKAEELAAKFTVKFKNDPHRFKALPGVTTNWGPEKMVMLYEFAADPDSVQQELADILGIDRSGISRKCNSMDWLKFEDALEKLVDMTKDEAIVHEAETESTKIIEKAEVKERRSLITRESFYRNLEKRIIESSQIPKIKSMPQILMPKHKNQHQAEHVGLLLSDLHVGQEFTKEESGGLNEFNLNVFQERAANLKSALGRIVLNHATSRELPELHIFGLGDNVQGGRENGEWGGAYTGHINVTDQAVMAADVIADLIQDWSKYFKKIHFLGVIGNHGRGGARKNSDAIGANWDNVTYIALKAKFENDPKVSIKYSTTFWMRKNILGTEFCIVHGDYFSSSVNSLLASNQKLQDLTTKILKTPYNVLCLGHFHSYSVIETSMGRIMVNGSFVGGDMHSMHHLRSSSRPTQTIFGIHPDHGVTWHYPLDLDITRK